MNVLTKIRIKNWILTVLFFIPSIFRKKASNKHIFLTIANKDFFYQLVLLIKSLRIYENEKVIIYDIGLTEQQKFYILKKILNVEIILFKFEDYPPHFNLKYNYGSYAWKIAAIHEVFFKYKCDLIYLDARNYITNPFYATKYYLDKKGYYFPYASGKIKDWTHPTTLKYFNDDRIGDNFNLNASYFGISFKNKKIQALVEELFSLSLNSDIISPIGSNRQNHRFDQSLLSCIFYRKYHLNPHSSISCQVMNLITHFDIIAPEKFNYQSSLIKNDEAALNMNFD